MSQRMLTRLLTGSLLVLSGAFDVSAQQISTPLLRPAAAPKLSAHEDTFTLASTSPVRVWQEGDPIRVKGDLKAEGGLAPTQLSPPRRDPVLRAKPTTLAAAGTGPNVVVPNVDGIPATGVLPPDPIIAVGPNHVIQMVNSAFAIYDKKGTKLIGPAQINSLWKGFGGPCESDNDGDPVVRYDHMADRWLLSQFAVHQNMQCIAISRGADPRTSGWYLYAFPTLDSDGRPVTPDYPKIGVWPDGYYMSTQRGFPSQGLDVWVFERDQMLAGKPARQVQFAVAAPSIVLQPADLNGPRPIAGTPNFFIRQVDGERFSGKDRIEIFALTVNWSDPTASTFKLVTSLPTAPFNSVLCTSDLMGACVPQPGTHVKLETLTAWPMYRAQYRNFGTHETMLLNHTVDATGESRAGIRWYELRRTGGGAWSIFQQGTHSPDAIHRWMGSIAMDEAGQIALGYSAGNETTPPGIRFAARRPSDPLGTLGSEIEIKKGGGSQTHATAPRWGDYSALEVDPAQPCTFWYSTLYYAQTSSAGWRTDISAVRMPQCTGKPQPK